VLADLAEMGTACVISLGRNRPPILDKGGIRRYPERSRIPDGHESERVPFVITQGSIDNPGVIAISLTE